MNVHVTSGYSNAMNMAQATEFWSHCLGHFVSVLHCRVCACGSYGGGDVHEGGGGRTALEVSPLPRQQNEMLEGWTQGIGSEFFPGLRHLQCLPLCNPQELDIVTCTDVKAGKSVILFLIHHPHRCIESSTSETQYTGFHTDYYYRSLWKTQY